MESGLGYYVDQLFDGDGLPKPFAKAPRLIVYKRELYDYAECINLATLAFGRPPESPLGCRRLSRMCSARWQRADGSFRSRQLMLGWDDVPMHRWAQAQLFRSLCGLLARR